MSTLEERVAKLEAQVELFQSMFTAIGNGKRAPAAQAQASSNSKPQSQPAVADDDLLSRDWADMEIRRDPPRGTQPSHVGKRMSECSEAYLLEYASFFEWKAQKGREEDPPRLNSKGKPWYEGDELTAKVARGWAQRARNAATAKRPQRAPRHEEQIEPPMEEDIPF